MPAPKPERICQHLRNIPDAPARTSGCEECLAHGTTWVKLRRCMTCGHVGCCDSSEGRHAQAHFDETGHPVIQSHEKGERWMWCYVDEDYVRPDAPSWRAVQQ